MDLETSQQTYNSDTQALLDIINGIITSGEIKEEDKVNLDTNKATYNSSYAQVNKDIKDTEKSYQDSQFDYIKNQIMDIKTNITENQDNIQFSVSGVVDSEEKMVQLGLSIEGVITSVSNLATGNDTRFSQLEDKFTWLVKSGTSESTMVLTDKLYQLMTEKVLIEAKDIELNGSININNGLFTVATNGNMKIGGLTGRLNTDGTAQGIFEVTSTGTLYSRNKTDANIYTMLTDGKITVKNNKGTLTFENGQIKVSDGSVSTYYGDGYIGHNLSIMVDTPRLNCTQKVTATEFTSSTDVILRSEQGNTTKPDGSTNNDGGKVYLACCGADASATDSRLLLFGKNSDGNYVFRPASKAGVIFVGTTTYPIGTVTAKTFNNLSDRSLKENIRYISNSIYENQNPYITVDDCYNFMKNDLPITLYNYLENNKLQIGFVAQDVIYNSDKTDSKVGQMIVNMESYVEGNEDAKLSYDINNVVGVTMATVQKIIQLVESQDLRIKTLEGLLNGSN